MKKTILQLFCLFSLLILSLTAIAQPTNDDCSNAIPLEIAADEASLQMIDGDTRNTVDATMVADAPWVCSASWYADDVWYTVTLGDEVPANGITIRVAFDQAGNPDDVIGIGMALYYEGCNAENFPFVCYSNRPGRTESRINEPCMAPNQTFLLRIFSSGSPLNDAGTFRIGVYETPEEPSTDNILWSGGQFDGGLDGWTTFDSICTNDTQEALWTWNTVGIAFGGSCGIGTITSNSNCNGAMVFASDALDNPDGGPCGGGGGECPAPQYGELISPLIDISAYDVDGISLKFEQSLRQFGSSYFVAWSIDEGLTWERKQINIDVPANAGANRVERVFLPGVAGNESLQIKFEHNANYYYWIIDDVELVETPAHDMSVNPFFAIPNYESIPASQVEPIYFLADIQNRGAFDQEDVNLNILIVNNTDGSEVYAADLNYGTITADSTAENIPFADSWTPPAIPGTYRGTYTITTSSNDPEFNLLDNTRSFTFNVIEEEGVFSKSGEGEGTGSLGINPALWDTGAPRSYGMGNFFHIEKGTTTLGEQLYCNSILFAMDNPEDVIDEELTIWLYKWTDANTDAVAQESELIPSGVTTYRITAEDVSQEEIQVAIANFTDLMPGVALEDNTDYIAMVQYIAPNPILDLRLSSSTARDYGAQRYMQRPTTAATNPGLGVGNPRYTTIFGNPPDGEFSSGVEYSTNSFGGNTVPIIKMNISTNPVYDTTTTTNNLGIINLVTIYPNPSNDILQVEVELTKTSKNAAIRIFDVNGNEISIKRIQNLKNQLFRYDVSNFANGTYFLNVLTDDGVKVEKFIVQH